MSKSLVGLFVRIPQELRDRIEIGRLAGFHERPLAAPGTQDFVTALLESGLALHNGAVAPTSTTFASAPLSYGVSTLGVSTITSLGSG